MKTVIFTNSIKDTDYATTKKIEKYLREQGCEVIITDINSEAVEPARLRGCSFALSVGGDGTILQAAKYALLYDIPITGINLGKTGFLTPIHKDRFEAEIDDIIRGDYTIDKRLMIELYDDTGVSYGHAINDVIFKHIIGEGVGNFKVYVDECIVSEYDGDGVIIAAPTGSTAYSLSIGGPIVNPGCELMIISPIAPHSLNSRSIIVNSDEVITVYFDIKNTVVSVDGRKAAVCGDKLFIRKSHKYCKFIKLQGYNFYSEVYKKIK